MRVFVDMFFVGVVKKFSSRKSGKHGVLGIVSQKRTYATTIPTTNNKHKHKHTKNVPSGETCALRGSTTSQTSVTG
jgi:hypothetical protein